MRYPDYLLKLIAVLKKLPGVGNRTAERFAFQLLDWPPEKLSEMGALISSLKDYVKTCLECGVLIEKERCFFCHHARKEPHLLCIVASYKDVFSIEETREYHGHYHVLGHLLSPIQGTGPTPMVIEKIKNRIKNLSIEEVIIALDSTLEGDATALFLKKEFANLSVRTSRLALGLPMGSSLDFIDEGTLGRALSFRRSY